MSPNLFSQWNHSLSQQPRILRPWQLLLDMVGWRDNYPDNHTGAKGFLALQYSMKKNSLVAAESSVTSSCVGDHA